MNIRANRFELSCPSRWLHRTIAVCSALFLSVLVGCSSAVTKLETWEGEPATAVNAATLKAPGAIHVSEVNGHSITNYLMDDLALDYALLPGENQVVFTYKTIWAKSGVVRNGESKVHVVESEPQVVRFEASPNETYSFEFDEPKSHRQAKQMLPEFTAAIVGVDGASLARSTPWSATASAPVARTPVSDELSQQPANYEPAGNGEASTLNELKAVWKTATDEEKKTFLRWAFE